MSNRVSCTSIENYQVLVRTGKHSWMADEPPEIDGDGLGPNPFDMLLAALGSCMIVSVVYYSERSKLPLERLYVEILGEQDKSKDRYQIAATVRARGDLDEQAMQRLTKAAHRCPVHKLLSAGADIEVKLERV